MIVEIMFVKLEILGILKLFIVANQLIVFTSQRLLQNIVYSQNRTTRYETILERAVLYCFQQLNYINHVVFILINIFEYYVLVTVPFTALVDRLNSPLHVVLIVLKILKIRTDFYPSLAPFIVRLKCAHVIRKIQVSLS